MHRDGLKRRLILVVLLMLLSCASHAETSAPIGGLFSWKQSAATQEAEQMFSLMQRYGLTELYQYFSQDASETEIENFLSLAAQREIRVYLLAGSAEWARESNGKSLRKIIKQAARWNEGLPEGIGFAGVMADVEPYLLDEWKDERRDALMQIYVQGFESAHRLAAKKELDLLACIPFFYDTTGCTEALERLVDQGCDGLAVMNYLRIDEAGQIRTEVELAQTYGKRIITIYELQSPGTAGLTDWHTYYNIGLDALWESIDAIQESFSPRRVDYALHYYPQLLEMDQRENGAS